MNSKITGVVVILIGIGAIVGIAYFIFFKNYYVPDEPSTAVNIDQTEQNDSGDVYSLPVDEQIDIEPVVVDPIKKKISFNINSESEQAQNIEGDLMRKSASFAERFGSYSNQSSFSNISDLRLFMTAAMKSWADSFIEENNAKSRDTSIYYGITTKALSQEILSLDEEGGFAKVKVLTLRRESPQNESPDASFYQDIEISFKVENKVWKIDSAFWK